MTEPSPAPPEPSVESAARDCPRCGEYSCGCFDEYPARAEPQRTPEAVEEAYYYELPEDAEYRRRLERKNAERKSDAMTLEQRLCSLVREFINEHGDESDALAESHAGLVAALGRALPVVVEAHKLNHSQGFPTEECHRCKLIADDKAALAQARVLVEEAGASIAAPAKEE